MDPQQVLQASLPQLQVPGAGASIYKEECAYSFHTAVCKTLHHFFLTPSNFILDDAIRHKS
jgi:hypothetical protein